MEALQAQKKLLSNLAQDSNNELAAEAEVKNLLEKISAVDGLPAELKEKLLEEKAQLVARLQVLETTKVAAEAIAEGVPATVGDRVSAVWESLVHYLPSSVQSRIMQYQGSACVAKANVWTAAVRTQERACEFKATFRDTVADPKVQVTAAAAAGGAVSLGASGGVAGFAGGGTLGAALGIVPAIFTFGLSIPVGAAIGAGTGLVVGTAAGGSVDLVGGGATGYGVYTKRKEIRTGAERAWSTAMDCGEYIQAKATSSKEFVKHQIAC